MEITKTLAKKIVDFNKKKNFLSRPRKKKNHLIIKNKAALKT